MKKIVLVLVCILMLCGCNDVKLSNGENAIVKFEKGGISSDELYKSLKTAYGAEKLMDLIDSYLLNELYETTDEETKYINQTLKTAKEAAEEYKVTLDYYVSQVYGVSSESEFKDYISLNYKRSLWIEDYGQEIVTDKQINEYYEKEVVGDIDASHILITVNASDTATDEEKEKAEKVAYQKAKDIIAKLKKGEDFSKLAKEYSEDDTTASKGGSLGKINKGDYADEVFDSLKSLKVGSYSTTPVKSSYGYHIVYKASQDKKEEITDELKTEIRATIGKEISSASSFYMTAMKALREKNKMEFVDTELEKEFENLVAQYENQTNN